MKNALLVFLYISICFFSKAQEGNFTLTIHLKDYDSGYTVLTYLKSDTTIHLDSDTAIISKAYCTFTGYTKSPFLAFLSVIDKRRGVNSGYFFIESGNIEFYFPKDSVYQFTPYTKGSKTNDLFTKDFKEKFRQINGRMDDSYNYWSSLSEKYGTNNIPINQLDSIRRDIKLMKHISDSIYFEYARKNPTSVIAFYKYYEMSYSPMLDSAFQLFSDSLKNSPIGILYKNNIRNERAQRGLTIFPAIELKKLNKTSFTLNFKENKLTLVDFWFLGCSPCRAQFPKFSEFYQKYKGKGFRILSITRDNESDLQDVRSYCLKNNIQWPQLWDEGMTLTNKIGINSYPSNYLVDKDGNILDKDIEPEKLETFLKKYFGS